MKFKIKNNMIEINNCNTEICIELCDFIMSKIHKTRTITIKINKGLYLSLVACLKKFMDNNPDYHITIMSNNVLEIDALPNNLKLIKNNEEG